MGATNPAKRRPGTIRGDLALAMPDNLVHGSDSPESAEREIALWFADDDSSDSAHEPRSSGTARSDEYQERHREHIGRSPSPAGAMWQLPETELQGLGDVAGQGRPRARLRRGAVVDPARRLGARPVGVDNSARQLEHARELIAAAGLDFPLVHAPAEAVPLADASFDIVFADHGAIDLRRPVPLGPRGGSAAAAGRPSRLLATRRRSRCCCCNDAGRVDGARRSISPYFGMHRIDEPDEPGRVRASVRRVDPALPRERLRDRATCGRCSRPRAPSPRYRTAERDGVGAQVADGADLDGAASGTDEHVAANRRAWTGARPSTPTGAARLGERRDRVGRAGRSRVRARALPDVPGKDSSSSAAAPRTSRPGSPAAARARSASTSPPRSSRPPGGCRPSRARVPAARGERGGRAAAGRALRPGGLRVRRVDLGRPVPLDPRGGAAAAAGRRLVFLVNGTLLILCVARRGAADRPRARSGAYFGMHRFEWDDDEAVEFHLGTATGSACCARTASRSRTDRDPGARGAPASRLRPLHGRSGRKRWPSEEIWRARKLA